MKHSTVLSLGAAAALLLTSILACNPSINVRGDRRSASGTSSSSSGFGAGAETITDDAGNTYTVEQGPRGQPAVVGCADGQREGLIDQAKYPAIAACLGTWSGAKNLRARGTGAACGDDKGPCAQPADLCAPGWRICGADGQIADLKGKLSASACEQAGGASYVAAISHCDAQQDCTYDDQATGGDGDGRYACFAQGWCSEPVCCGRACAEVGACPSGVWPDKTHIPVGTDQGCGAMTASRAGGVLCCKI
jgi:hypothetical protein